MITDEFAALSEDPVDGPIADPRTVTQLVEENTGWAISIAKSVARSWNLDWQLDGLDGGALEALVFCAQRYDPIRGVPFRAYARRRIHESSTEEARKSKSWKHHLGTGSEAEQNAREISLRLFDLFPELRDGFLPSSSEPGNAPDEARVSIRRMLASASSLAFAPSTGFDNPEKAAEYREVFSVVGDLDLVHQLLIWEIYWKGSSMRALAGEWEVDELAIIREHKELMNHVFSTLSGKKAKHKRLKVRPVLRPVALRMVRSGEEAPFSRFRSGFATVMILLVLGAIAVIVGML